MAQVREVTLKMSARLVKKLERLADLSSVSPETLIEGHLADYVRWAEETQLGAAKDASESEEEDGGPKHQGYL